MISDTSKGLQDLARPSKYDPREGGWSDGYKMVKYLCLVQIRSLPRSPKKLVSRDMGLAC